MNIKTYSEYAKEVETRLNISLEFPIPCFVYETVRGEVFSVKVNIAAPQIILGFRAPGSVINQTMYYSYNGKPQVKFESESYANEFAMWQRALELAFKQVQDAPDPSEMSEAVVEEVFEAAAEDPGSKETEVLVEPVIEERSAEEVDLVPATTSERSEEPETAATAYDAFISWAIENLRALGEDKASFKKDIPEEFSQWAATKRTTVDSEVLAELAARCS